MRLVFGHVCSMFMHYLLPTIYVSVWQAFSKGAPCTLLISNDFNFNTLCISTLNLYYNIIITRCHTPADAQSSQQQCSPCSDTARSAQQCLPCRQSRIKFQVKCWSRTWRVSSSLGTCDLRPSPLIPSALRTPHHSTRLTWLDLI